MALAPGPEDGICAARGCSRTAQFVIEWTNPKVGRPKQWLACDQHREELTQYFAYRDFPVTVTPLPGA